MPSLLRCYCLDYSMKGETTHGKRHLNSRNFFEHPSNTTFQCHGFNFISNGLSHNCTFSKSVKSLSWWLKREIAQANNAYGGQIVTEHRHFKIRHHKVPQFLLTKKKHSIWVSQLLWVFTELTSVAERRIQDIHDQTRDESARNPTQNAKMWSSCN